jgi:hypothetical protein
MLNSQKNIRIKGETLDNVVYVNIFFVNTKFVQVVV